MTVNSKFGCALVLTALSLGFHSSLSAAQPIRALLITGGCCHDYASQKGILKKGLEARANIVVDQVHTPDGSTHPPLAILGNPKYADGYDLVIHDECGSDINDEATVKGVIQPHRDGLPGVNLHCAMHSYRIGNPNTAVESGTPHGYWFEYLGLQSSGHGPQEPIAIKFADLSSPIVKGLEDWTTMREELYNNVHVFDGAHVLARGTQKFKQGGAEKSDEYVVVWTNEFGPKKAKVFSTTIGHNNGTVEDPKYLDLVTRGVLWATGHLKADGTPAEGYGAGGK